MKTLTAILLLAALTGCGRGAHPNVDPAFASIYAEFQADMAQRHVSPKGGIDSIQFGNSEAVAKDSEAVGVCDDYKITIDRTYFNGLSDNMKKLMIYHELGHCVLQRAHDNDYKNGTYCLKVNYSGTCEEWSNIRFVSIMNSQLPDHQDVDENPDYRTALIDELFSEDLNTLQ